MALERPLPQRRPVVLPQTLKAFAALVLFLVPGGMPTASAQPAEQDPSVVGSATPTIESVHWAGSGAWVLATLGMGLSALLGAPARRLRLPRTLLAEGSEGNVRIVGVALRVHDEPESDAGGPDLFVKERHWRYTGNRWQFLGEQWDAGPFWVEDKAGAVKVDGTDCWFTGVRPILIYNGAPGEGWRPVPRLGDTRVLRWSIPEGQTVTATGFYDPHPPRLRGTPDGVSVLVLTSEARAAVLRRGHCAAVLHWLAWLALTAACTAWAG